MSACVSCSISAGLDRVRRPDAGVAVGLQLRADGLALRAPARRRGSASRTPSWSWTWWPYSWAITYAWTNGVTVDAELRLQLVEEAEVDVDELVGRAVERARPSEVASPHPVCIEPVKKTVSTCWYCLPLRWKTPFQNFWTLLTTPTIRQSSRWFASCAGLAVLGDRARRVALSDLRVVERLELAEPAAAAGEQRDQQVDDERDDAEPAAADGEAAGAHAAPADVGDLTRVERVHHGRKRMALFCLRYSAMKPVRLCASGRTRGRRA